MTTADGRSRGGDTASDAGETGGNSGASGNTGTEDTEGGIATRGTPAAASLPPLDDEGYLIEPADWNEAVAEELARREDIRLTDEHWEVIRFMRGFYEAHQVAADARFAIRHLAERIGPRARTRLFELFPYGYVKQACRIAGMKRPRAWSTG